MATDGVHITITGRSEEIAETAGDVGYWRTRATQDAALALTAMHALEIVESDIEWLLDDLWQAQALLDRIAQYIETWAPEMHGAQRVSARLLQQQIGRWRDGA